CGAISIFALKGSSVRCRNGLLAHTCSQTGPSLAAARTCGHHRDPPETSLSSEVRRLSDQLEEPRPVLVRESVTRPYDAYAFRTSAAVHDSAPGGYEYCLLLVQGFSDVLEGQVGLFFGHRTDPVAPAVVGVVA